MICPMGGFPTIRHNEVCNLTASLLSTVCHNVATEPCLLEWWVHEVMLYHHCWRGMSRHPSKRILVYCTRCIFWCEGFHPNASSNNTESLSSVYKRHEDIKKRVCGQRVHEVEHRVFTPLVLSTSGGMGREATTFYKRLADMLATHQRRLYSIAMSWLRCKLSFTTIRASIMCIRGTQPVVPPQTTTFALATSRGQHPQI